MLILTSFFLLRQNQFNSSTIFRSLAYSIALSVRQAQVYGTSLRQANSTFTAKSYGVNFNTGNIAEASPRYILFVDNDSDGLYDPTDSPSEFVQDFKINRSFTIRKFCAVLGSAQHCNIESAGGGSVKDALNIYFERPDLDAKFCTAASQCNYSEAYIQIQSGTGALRNVVVLSTGQISVCSLNAVYPAC